MRASRGWTVRSVANVFSYARMRFDYFRPEEVNLDRALWISWYDLPDSGRDAYLSWLHGTYMPKLVKRPGFLYAAHFKSVIPGGSPGGGRFPT